MSFSGNRTYRPQEPDRSWIHRIAQAVIASALFACASVTPALAQTLAERAGTLDRPHLSFNGTPGLVDMPDANMMPDGDLALTFASFGASNRGTLTFQIAPRLMGSFRYARIADFDQTQDTDTRFDRSFDLVYQLTTESAWRPSVAVGLRDFGGSGLYSGEYLVATKTLRPARVGKIQLTGGLGWGRFATQNGFTNPLGIIDKRFETRPARGTDIANTGRFRPGDLFRGDAAFFGGVSWQPTDNWTFVAEYSSDDYNPETRRGLLERDSSYNFGANYRFSSGFDVGLYYLYGSEIGFKFSYVLNPKVPPVASGIEPGPQPVQPRPDRRSAPQVWTTAWAGQEAAQTTLEQSLIGVLAPEGLVLESLSFTATEARVSLRNRRFGRSAQAIGRAARAMTRALPASVETFQITLVERGMPTTRVTVQRSDLEELEFAPDNAWQSYVRAGIEDAGDQPNARQSVASPRLTFAVTPYIETAFFDPNAPFLFDLGLRAGARYEPRPGLVFNASLRQPLYGNRDNTNRESDSVLQFVRSEQDDYNRGGGPKLDRLTVAHYFRPGSDLYGRVTAGYLETAFAGVSAEVLWKPATSRLALGLEVNAVHQREPGDIFGLGEGVFDHDVVTGHASAYYAFENGFHAQVDLGRYLAEDWGGTFTLAREFRNGWQVGAFFTLTDVSFDDFGEGSFDKGIFLTLPTSWAIGQPSRQERTSIIRPIQRDGGARLVVPDRLYDLVREDSDPLLGDSWGRFWR